MEKDTCYFKLQYIAKPGRAVYFIFNWGVFRTLSNVEDGVFSEKFTSF